MLRCFLKYVSQHFNTSPGSVFGFPSPLFATMRCLHNLFLSSCIYLNKLCELFFLKSSSMTDIVPQVVFCCGFLSLSLLLYSYLCGLSRFSAFEVFFKYSVRAFLLSSHKIDYMLSTLETNHFLSDFRCCLFEA